MSAAWNKFYENVCSVRQALQFHRNEECFYRGHSHTEHKLLPGLFRPSPYNVGDAETLSFEYHMFFEFRARAKEVHSGDLTDWDILFFMQHHGVRTRLLDWTESFGVALYFALHNYSANKSKPCIWLLNPYALNEKYAGVRDLYSPEYLDDKQGNSYGDYLVNGARIPWDKPIALYPIRRVSRLTTQCGYFTIQGNDPQPLEQIESKNSNIITRIDLPEDAVEGGFEFLEMAGINDYSMFPDLDGLARYLNKKYFG